MRPRALLGVAAALAIAAGAAAFRLIRRRRELAAKAYRPGLSAGPPVEEATVPPAARVSDEPLARQTRFDEHLDEEEQRRHAAARRLRAELEEEAP